MQNNGEPEIVATERLDNGVVVTFRDGRSVFYSAALLHEISAQGKDQTDIVPDNGGK
jgi:hypothetical protein